MSRAQFTGAPGVLAIVLPIIVEKPELELVNLVKTFTQKGQPLIANGFERQQRKVWARERRKREKV